MEHYLQQRTLIWVINPQAKAILMEHGHPGMYMSEVDINNALRQFCGGRRWFDSRFPNGTPRLRLIYTPAFIRIEGGTLMQRSLSL
jgi:hypothetical protein